MSYQALLFCLDERTARVVSQVLSDLEFVVEPCNEPFAAVKKLMTQHFDAIVVDCDNEQNAALLFKSARNSGSNQSSLSVAMVEGQAGVAKAFRLGANLVLSKPINIEQSKGTLRVARGLLRKGQAGKPAPVAVSLGVQEPIATQHLPELPTFATPRAVIAPPVANASFELEAEPAPLPDAVDAALLECMPDSSPSSVEVSEQSVTEAASTKEYAWQPRSKPMAEPMASALRRAAEAAGKADFDNPATSHVSLTQSGSGAAAAPARAKESKVEPFESKPVVKAQQAPAGREIAHEPAVVETAERQSSAPAKAAVSLPSLDHSRKLDVRELQASNAGGSKKTVLIAVVLLGVAVAGYFGWSKMQSGHSQNAAQSIAAGAASLPPAPAAAVTQPSENESALQPPDAVVNGSPQVLAPSKPSAAVAAEVPGVKALNPVKAASSENAASEIKATSSTPPEPRPALIVNNGVSNQPKPVVTAEEPEQPPTATSIATGTDNSALTGIVNTNAINAQKAPQQTLRISQGVSQGLILKRVQPVYPAQALQMRIEGAVELQATISNAGNITGLRQLTGHPILGRAAMEAVRQWKYKPYFLNGEPVEVQTQITVNFKLP